MTLNRRALMRKLALGTGGALFSPFAWPNLVHAAAPGSPKRVVFFLQNHGFNPGHAMPEKLGINDKVLDKVVDMPLQGMTLPPFIEPLSPYLAKLTIVQGLNGRHVNPYHGGPYGALGGFKKSSSTPTGETIDCGLGQALPAVVPLLALGWESLAKMRGNPVHYASSAWGLNKPVPMYCDPVLAHGNIFGVAMPGAARDEFEADTELYDFLKQDASLMRERLQGREREKFQPYLEGFEEAGARRRKLLAMASTLAKHAPALDRGFEKPGFETDWWEASLKVGIASLASGVTNVLTIASGMCTASGTWHGLSLNHVGHSIGHTDQMKEPDWLKLRRYNMELLMKIVKGLEAVPEGTGTMMDNTLIVYTSDFGESQHSTGNRWPFLLLGNLGGTLRSGRYLHFPIEPHAKSRTINAFYNTLLTAVGSPRDRFNLTGSMKDLDWPGPIAELLV